MNSEWRVMLLEDGQEVSMSVGEARAIGYGIDATTDRIVFRSGYLQPHVKFVEASVNFSSRDACIRMLMLESNEGMI